MSYNVKVNGKVLPELYSEQDIRGYASAWREYRADVQVALSGTHTYVSLAKFMGEPEPPPRPQPAPAYAPPIQTGYAPPVQPGYAPPTGYAPPAQSVSPPTPGGYVQPKQFNYIPPPEASGYRSGPIGGDGSILKVVGIFAVLIVVGSLAIYGGLNVGPRYFSVAIISLVLGLYRLAKS